MNKDLLKTDNTKTGAIALKGTIIGVLSAFAMMLLFSAIMLVFELERNIAAPFATVSVAAGSFFAAFYCAKKIGKKGYLIGLITGIITFALITLVAFIISDKGFTYNTLFHFVIIVLSSLLGGILGINMIRSKRYI